MHVLHAFPLSVILAMSMTAPLWKWSSVAITSMEIASNHSLLERSFFLGLCLLIRGVPGFYHSLKLACQTLTLVFPLLLLIITLEEITIKQKYHRYYLGAVRCSFCNPTLGLFYYLIRLTKEAFGESNVTPRNPWHKNYIIPL